jgi:hypothetical protein
VFERLKQAYKALDEKLEPKPKVVRTISAKVLRFGAYGSEFSTWYTVLLEGHSRPFRVYYHSSGVPLYVELTAPGDLVTLGIDQDGGVLTFSNPSLPR